MAISIIGQGAVGTTDGRPSNRTVDIKLAMRKGDIIIVSSMPNIGGSYQSSTVDIDGFTKLSINKPKNHNIHMYFKTVDKAIDSISFTFLSCYVTTWMVIRGGIVESFSKTATFPATINFSDSKKRMVFLTGAYPNAKPWIISQYSCYDASYTTFYGEFQTSAYLPQHSQYSTPDGEKNYLIIKEGTLNIPPTKPGVFIKQPLVDSVNLSKEVIELSWGASTDPENNAITYQVEFYDGMAWNVVASNISSTTYKHTLPVVNIKNAQYRVKAIDSEGDSSDYISSDRFQVYRYLTLIRDNGKTKALKNSEWVVI